MSISLDVCMLCGANGESCSRVFPHCDMGSYTWRGLFAVHGDNQAFPCNILGLPQVRFLIRMECLYFITNPLQLVIFWG